MLNDPLGMMSVTAAGFAYMVSNLRSLAEGKVVVVLEGGYSLDNLEEAEETVVKVLLDKDFPQLGETGEATEEGVEAVRATHCTAREFFRLEGE